MKFFTAKQNEEITAKLEAAESENESLRNELSEAQAKIEELTGNEGATAALNIELSEAKAKVLELETKAVEYDEKILELTESNKVTAEKVSIQAAELLAAQGHPAPVALEGGDLESASNTLTRHAFNALAPKEKMAFIKKGGKLS